MWARHAIAYDDLESYFYAFSVWDEHNRCLSWEETVEWCELLGLHHVPILYDGPFDGRLLERLYGPDRNGRESEGWVLRTAGSFPYRQFRRHVAKYVRESHPHPHGFWSAKPIPNQLRADGDRKINR